MYRKDIIRINEFSGNRICQKSAHLCCFSLHARARARTHTHTLSLSLSHTLSPSHTHTHTHRLEKYVALVTLMIPFHWLREVEKKRRRWKKEKQQIWTGRRRRPYRISAWCVPNRLSSLVEKFVPHGVTGAHLHVNHDVATSEVDACQSSTRG